VIPFIIIIVVFFVGFAVFNLLSEKNKWYVRDKKARQMKMQGMSCATCIHHLPKWQCGKGNHDARKVSICTDYESKGGK